MKYLSLQNELKKTHARLCPEFDYLARNGIRAKEQMPSSKEWGAPL